VELLRGWVDPSERSLDADELACALIAEQMRRQKKPMIMRNGNFDDNDANAPLAP